MANLHNERSSDSENDGIDVPMTSNYNMDDLRPIDSDESLFPYEELSMRASMLLQSLSETPSEGSASPPPMMSLDYPERDDDEFMTYTPIHAGQPLSFNVNDQNTRSNGLELTRSSDNWSDSIFSETSKSTVETLNRLTSSRSTPRPRKEKMVLRGRVGLGAPERLINGQTSSSSELNALPVEGIRDQFERMSPLKKIRYSSEYTPVKEPESQRSSEALSGQAGISMEIHNADNSRNKPDTGIRSGDRQLTSAMLEYHNKATFYNAVSQAVAPEGGRSILTKPGTSRHGSEYLNSADMKSSSTLIGEHDDDRNLRNNAHPFNHDLNKSIYPDPPEKKREEVKHQFKQPIQVESKLLGQRKLLQQMQSEKVNGWLEHKDKNMHPGRPTVSETSNSTEPTTWSAFEQITLNKNRYTVINEIGRGGTSRVYKVVSHKYNEVFAVKRVSLENVEDHAYQGYMNEIELLKTLSGHDRIVRLHDFEINPSRKAIYMLMELGEIDLAHLMAKQRGKPINKNFIRMYWEQMLEAVHAIHQHKIVHSDLKPANFLLVEGSLKLIDFGIAKAITNDTTNIHRDHQIGTINYMSPEAILDTNDSQLGKSLYKLGRSSDVWSLGCILYQMVYARTPFHHLNMWQKIRSIPDENCQIPFPLVVVPSPPAGASDTGVKSAPQADMEPVPVEDDLLDVMKSCLNRNAAKRMTIPQLLNHSFVRPKSSSMISGLEKSLHDVTDRLRKTGVLESDKELQKLIQVCMSHLPSQRSHE